jgi:hypothetical protein
MIMKTTNGNLQTTSSSSLLNIRLQQLLLLLLLLLLCSICDAIHIKSSCPPDAFQSAPLKVPEDGLPFCSAYRDLACCAAEDTLQIQNTVLSMMKKECRSCFSMVSEWKCAECDPDAGECIFPKSNNKQTNNERPIRRRSPFSHIFLLPFSKGRFYYNAESCEHDTRLRLCADYCKAVFETCKDIPFSVG